MTDARRTAEDRLEHELKVWPDYFDALETGAKTFEVRLNDRDFRNGDTLWLREWNQGVGYTGRSIRRTVTNILRGPAFGIEDKYVCMALRAEAHHSDSRWPEGELNMNISDEMKPPELPAP
jgi:hypothetical protein